VKTNIFCISAAEVSDLRTKLESTGMSVIREVDQDGWHGEFFYSTNPRFTTPGWAETFRSYFDEVEIPVGKNHYAAFVFTKGERCLVLSFGKSHFYIRPYCDYDYGIELAKRIANERDIRQTASKRFNARRRKDIKSFVRDTHLDIESGESVEYLQAGIIDRYAERFGKSGHFGTSAQLSPDIVPAEIGTFLTDLEAALQEPALFPVARTIIISEKDEVERLDERLLDELTSPRGTTEFAHNTYDLYGVDFIFSAAGSFELRCPNGPKLTYESLSMGDLKDYISAHTIPRNDILRIKIRHIADDSPSYTQTLKESVDYIADDGSRVLLAGGKWMYFNQDYLDALDESLRTIRVEETESQFADIAIEEGDFNLTTQAAGYEVADKDFDIFKTRASTQIEAWDLRKNDRVYAVKFGTPQKLGYVCDQATGVLELLRNAAGVRKVPHFSSYCLWLGYRAQGRVEDITKTGSIILKQKIETWARKARDLGVEPVLKYSRKVKPGIDVPDEDLARERAAAVR
jgi:uncharacterized protein (TIGR04141 family)